MEPGCRTTGWGILLKCPGCSGCPSGLVDHIGPVIEPFAGGVLVDFREVFQEVINDNKESDPAKIVDAGQWPRISAQQAVARDLLDVLCPPYPFSSYPPDICETADVP